MDLYGIALFVHLLALVAGIAASTMAHFVFVQLNRATTVPEARRALGTLSRTSKIFPAVLITFLASGSYMVAQRWSWQTGFVTGGSIVVLLLFANGAILGPRAKKLGMALAHAGDGAIAAPVRARIHDPLLNTLPWVNLALVLGTVFVMTVKPSLGGVGATLVVAVAAGLLLARRLSPTRAAAGSASPATERA